jgi:endo-1,4-beta-xylanase
LWQTAFQKGIVYGSSAATWQLSDSGYRRLFAREATIIFTEDDLLWYRLRPSPDSGLDFKYGDKIASFARRQGLLMFGAHLVWDEGFGEGWTDDDLWGMDEETARDLLFGTIEAVVDRYRGRMAGWIVANEVLDGSGLRTDVPWHSILGPSYVAESFRIAHASDPEAVLVLNDFGFETDDDFAAADDKRAAALQLLDDLLDSDTPVHALGVQAHLLAQDFREAFDAGAYRTFLSEVASRDVNILITEMDVLDDGLPREVEARDRAIAEAVGTYLEVALDEPAVASLMTFGLSDRYTWLEEDYPRNDGAPRRPLPFDEGLRPKPAYDALATALGQARPRKPLWRPPPC